MASEKNGNLKPEHVSRGSGKRVWWKCIRGHEWETDISSRTLHKKGCPFCAGQKVSPEKSLASFRPDLILEWNNQKNEDLTPYDVLPSSDKKVWWKCDKEHEWETAVKVRTRGHGCPYCSNQKVSKEISLAESGLDFVREWNLKEMSD
ncbi:zinc-ribbon domain-containing protein [Peribacillus sp. NPDC097206]|uniref:zinc-ribbon domain-containing protein n=1 Tax=unclassified Peribacillus TaxID=2675266 RepID=UPI0038078656